MSRFFKKTLIKSKFIPITQYEYLFIKFKGGLLNYCLGSLKQLSKKKT